jgi:hypothetical protein
VPVLLLLVREVCSPPLRQLLPLLLRPPLLPLLLRSPPERWAWPAAASAAAERATGERLPLPEAPPLWLLLLLLHLRGSEAPTPSAPPASSARHLSLWRRLGWLEEEPRACVVVAAGAAAAAAARRPLRPPSPLPPAPLAPPPWQSACQRPPSFPKPRPAAWATARATRSGASGSGRCRARRPSAAQGRRRRRHHHQRCPSRSRACA